MERICRPVSTLAVPDGQGRTAHHPAPSHPLMPPRAVGLARCRAMAPTEGTATPRYHPSMPPSSRPLPLPAALHCKRRGRRIHVHVTSRGAQPSPASAQPHLMGSLVPSRGVPRRLASASSAEAQAAWSSSWCRVLAAHPKPWAGVHCVGIISPQASATLLHRSCHVKDSQASCALQGPVRRARPLTGSRRHHGRVGCTTAVPATKNLEINCRMLLCPPCEIHGYY